MQIIMYVYKANLHVFFPQISRVQMLKMILGINVEK
jgi:hypothetical protein